MAWVKGFNFRNTSGYVTDPTDTTYFRVHDGGGGDSYPTTRNSVTFGSTNEFNSNRENCDSGLDPRIAGRSYIDNNRANQRFLQFDLEAPDQYDIVLSSSSPLFGQDNPLITIYDNTTLLATLVSQTGNYPSSRFIDANNVVHTSAANWVADNTPRRLTFTTTTAVVRYGRGDGSTSGATSIGHIQFTRVPSESARKQYFVKQAIHRASYR